MYIQQKNYVYMFAHYPFVPYDLFQNIYQNIIIITTFVINKIIYTISIHLYTFWEHFSISYSSLLIFSIISRVNMEISYVCSSTLFRKSSSFACFNCLFIRPIKTIFCLYKYCCWLLCVVEFYLSQLFVVYV